MLALRSLLTGAGSRVGSPVAEVVVVQVEDTRLSSPGGKLLRKRCGERRSLQFVQPHRTSARAEIKPLPAASFCLTTPALHLGSPRSYSFQTQPVL